MAWYLVMPLLMYAGHAEVNGNPISPVGVPNLEMPSQEVCEQIAKLNPGSECWMKVASASSNLKNWVASPTIAPNVETPK